MERTSSAKESNSYDLCVDIRKDRTIVKNCVLFTILTRVSGYPKVIERYDFFFIFLFCLMSPHVNDNGLDLI